MSRSDATLVGVVMQNFEEEAYTHGGVFQATVLLVATRRQQGSRKYFHS